MSSFIQWLEGASAADNRVRAVLRRSLSFAPGDYPPAYPYVEPFVSDSAGDWKRKAQYLVAGLWALHFRNGRTGPPKSIGKACADHQAAKGQGSTERRFINLLDADSEQLPHRLRQLIALLQEHTLDFEGMLDGLIFWNSSRKGTQNRWARDFYRNIRHESDDEAKEQSKNQEKTA